jgi:hypothetical protein
MGDSNSDEDGGEVDGDGVGVNGVNGDGSGAIPRPGSVPEQRLLPPKLVFDGGGAAELFP